MKTVESCSVVVRAKVAHRGVGETTVLVLSTGEMMVKVYSPREGLCFVSAERAGLSELARRRAWEKSGFKRS